jgi:hypothetical protein
MIWWAEGTKSRLDKRWQNTRSYPIEITNTNPLVIRLFIDFLTEELTVPLERVRVQLQIHEGDDQNELESYWASLVGVPRSQFNKTIIRPVGRKVGKSKGTCKIRFADKGVYEKLEGMLVRVLEETYVGRQTLPQTLPHYEFVFSSVKINR